MRKALKLFYTFTGIAGISGIGYVLMRIKKETDKLKKIGETYKIKNVNFDIDSGNFLCYVYIEMENQSELQVFIQKLGNLKLYIEDKEIAIDNKKDKFSIPPKTKKEIEIVFSANLIDLIKLIDPSMIKDALSLKFDKIKETLLNKKIKVEGSFDVFVILFEGKFFSKTIKVNNPISFEGKINDLIKK